MNAICPHVCKACYAMTVCAVHAIGERPDAILLNPELCIGCGCCKTACETFGGAMIKHRAVSAERVKPLPAAPGSPWTGGAKE
jgi:Fe-S-cluster-containing hydrogenase component 2